MKKKMFKQLVTADPDAIVTSHIRNTLRSVIRDGPLEKLRGVRWGILKVHEILLFKFSMQDFFSAKSLARIFFLLGKKVRKAMHYFFPRLLAVHEFVFRVIFPVVIFFFTSPYPAPSHNLFSVVLYLQAD